MIKNFIGGAWINPKSGNFLDNYNPALGEVYSQIPDSDAEDVEEAVQAAIKALPRWKAKGVKGRSAILHEISVLIEKNLDELARAESIDNGKPLSLAKKMDIPRAAENFRFFSQAILNLPLEQYKTEDEMNTVARDPIGIVGCISPWNLPLYLFTWKIAPALAAGNCVIAKPSEITPMTAHLLTKICIEAGLPAGVLNVVHGVGAKVGDAITRHPRIRAISFTGSTRTGGEIAKIAAESFKKVSLEMGGKNPSIIFADADFEEALKNTVRSAFLNQGQICLCGSRIFVEKPIYEKFRNALVEKVKGLKVGNPLDESTDQGAVVSKEHYEKILSCLETAKKEGGKFLTGGKALFINKGGWFIEPTLIEGLDNNCQTNQEEIFGPVATIQSFETVEEVVEAANSTRYGLSANIWSKDIAKAETVASQIDAGVIWINCWMLRDLRTPFGGMKDSGVGREGGIEALHFFTEAKNVCVKL